MAEREAPSGVFWCSVALFLLGLYVAAYACLRWQNVLIYDVDYPTGADGITRSRIAITANDRPDESTELQRAVALPAETVFFPLCEIETAIRWELRDRHGE